MHKYRLAIFDLDGTLIHYEINFFLEESLRIIHQLGYAKVSREELALNAAHNDLFAFVPQTERAEFSHAFHELFDERGQPPAQPLQGALDTLEFLASNNMELAICTARSSLPHQVEEAILHTGFMQHISIISTRGPVVRSWGDKSSQINELLRKFAVEAKQAVMVGDNPIDIVSARKVNLGFSIAVLSGGIAETVLKATQPDLLLPDVTSINQHFPFERKEAPKDIK